MRLRVTFVCFALLIISSVAFAQPTGQLRMSPEEQNAARAIMSAPDVAHKVTAASDFIKSFWSFWTVLCLPCCLAR